MSQLDHADRQAALTDSVVLGADHAGYHLKEYLKDILQGFNLRISDLGTDSPAAADYPQYAHAVAREVAEGRAGRGVLVCGTGIGMAIAANRHRGVRAVVCYSEEQATYSRSHNNANVLALASRWVPPETAKKVVHVFLSTAFEGGRHERRLAKIAATEKK